VKLGVVARASSWLLTVALAAPAAEAAPFSRVALLLPACEAPGLAASELRAAVALDLRDVSLTLAPAGELSSATDVLVQVATDCSTHSQFTLQAQFGDERHTRSVDLSELAGPQRARALSLAVAELLALFGQPAAPPSTSSVVPPAAAEPGSKPAESEPLPAIAPTPKPSPTPRPNAPVPTNAAPPLRDRPSPKRAAATWSLSLAPELRFFDATWLWGGRALAHYGAWSAGLDVLRAEENVLPGRVTTLLLHGSLAYSPVISELEWSRLEAGLRSGFGRTFMTAEASAAAAAHDAQDLYLDAALTARYSLQASPALRFGLGVELGYARGPIGYADDVEVARTAGAFASVLLDVAVHP
jgi:hypothetical protein